MVSGRFLAALARLPLGKATELHELRLVRLLGQYTGKGKNKTFQVTNTFIAGEAVVIRGYLVDVNTGLPVANATADIAITDPETTSLTAGPNNIEAGIGRLV